MLTLREKYDYLMKAGKFELRGFVKIACLDEDHKHLQCMGEDGMTMVAKGRKEGGVEGAPDAGHRRYGEGVVRRVISAGMKPIIVEENWRPDTGKKLEPAQHKIFADPEKLLEHPITKSFEEHDKDLQLYDEIRFLAVSIELELYDKNIQDKAPTDFELRFPRELFDKVHQAGEKDFNGYPIVYGVSGEVSLRHKRTGITRKTKWEASNDGEDNSS